MKKLLFLFTQLALFHLTGFTQTSSNGTIPFNKIMIDPLSAMGGGASNIFEEVNYIPLETTKESLFGEIDKLFITDTYFIVYDHVTAAILFFNKDGSFHHKINKIKFDVVYAFPDVPGVRKVSIRDIHVDAVRHQLLIRSVFETMTIYVLNFEGTRIDKRKIPYGTQDYFPFSDSAGFYKQTRPHSINEASLYQPYDVSFYKDSVVTPPHLFPINFNSVALLGDLYSHPSHFHYSGNPGHCFYTPDFDYNIYELDSTGIRQQYQLVLPKDLSLPPNFGYDSSYKNKRFAYLENKQLINNCWVFYQMGDYVVLQFRISSAILNQDIFTMLYSLKTTRLIALDHISTDEKSYFLPITNFDTADILACDGKSIFVSFSSLRMFAAHENMGDKEPNYSPLLDNYFNTQNRKGNPVIVQLKPKGNL